MTKSEAIEPFRTATNLAKALGISKAAVSQWPEERIPREHELTLKYELCPQHFQQQKEVA